MKKKGNIKERFFLNVPPFLKITTHRKKGKIMIMTRNKKEVAERLAKEAAARKKKFEKLDEKELEKFQIKNREEGGERK